MIQRILPFLFIFLTVHLYAQTDEPLTFEHINGLSQNTVYSILRDKQGFMWIATANGLNRYDGVEMKIYKPAFGQTKGEMGGRIIRSGLIEDDKEQIWFATDVTVNSFNKKTQEFNPVKLYLGNHSAGSTDQTPNALFFSNPILQKDSLVWFATAIEGLFSLNLKTNKSSNYPVGFKDKNGVPVALMYNGIYDNKGKLWFASRNGLLCFDLATHAWSQFIPEYYFFSLSICRDTIYLGNGAVINWFDTRSHVWGICKKTNDPAYIKEGMVRRIITDSKMNTWAGDQEGNIYYKEAEKNEFVWKGNINGNSISRTNYPVYCLYADTTGNLWVGADVLGLLKAETKPAIFKNYPDAVADGSNQNLFIYSIYEEDEENIFLGTFQNGLLHVNKTTRKTAVVKFPYLDLKLPYARSVPLIKEDSKGNLWTSYSGYLYIKEKGKKDFIPLKIPVPQGALQSPQLWHVSEYNNEWLLSTNVGLYTVSLNKGQYSFRYHENFGISRYLSTWITPDKKIWAVSETGGILIYDSLGIKESHNRLFPGINAKAVMYEEDRGLVWISTSNGLVAFHFPTGRYRLYNESDGLLNSYVYGALLDKKDIWLSTNNGLAKGVIRFEKDSILPEISFVNYTTAEGLPVNEFNTGSFYKSKSGTFYFGSTKGVVWFKPGEIKPNINVPKLQLTNFLVNEKKADSLVAPEYISSIRLPYFKNSLFFQFRGIDFDNGNKVRYKYQLEGWDKDWIYSNQLNQVRYNNLPHGTYLFKVSASGNAGQWSNDIRTVSIIIYPPFWKTWWFYTLAAVLVIGLIILLTRRIAQRKLKKQLEELEKQRGIDKERLRISREMHDDIGAGLTQITLMSESAKNKMGTGNERELTDIGDTSRKLVNNMSEIIWSLNPEYKTLEQLCSYLREQINKQLEYSGIEFTVELPENGSDVVLSNEQRRNVLLVTKEIVNNAIKYSKAKNIVVNGSYKDHRIQFEVSDDGKGFDSEKPHNGNGLRNIKQRISELNGQVVIRSSAGHGTHITYSIPLN